MSAGKQVILEEIVDENYVPTSAGRMQDLFPYSQWPQNYFVFYMKALKADTFLLEGTYVDQLDTAVEGTKQIFWLP